MSERRDAFLRAVEAQRLRQLDLPGSELDVKNTPNEWVAIIGHYLHEEVRRGGYVPEVSAFEDALEKAAAVIAAAYEHVAVMKARGELR
jgi:hypothetical protein